MTEEQIEAMRKWVRAEIEYAIASREVGSDGYVQSAYNERDYAENCFQIVKKLGLVTQTPWAFF